MNPNEFDHIARLESDFWWFRGMDRILFPLLDAVLDSRLRVLEAGCGTGRISRCIADRYRCTVDALDLSPRAMGLARAFGLKRLLQADVRQLPLRPGTYDAVLSLDVLVHLPEGEEVRALAEFHRVLRPGGVLVLRLSALDLLRSRHSVYVGERQRLTRARLRRGLTEAGFHPGRISYANSFLLPVALFKFRVWEPLTGAQAGTGIEDLPTWLNRALEWVLRLEAAVIARGWDFPVGQSLLAVARKPA